MVEEGDLDSPVGLNYYYTKTKPKTVTTPHVVTPARAALSTTSSEPQKSYHMCFQAALKHKDTVSSLSSQSNAAAKKACKWKPNTTLRCRFIDGNRDDVKQKVQQIVKEWEKYCSIKFLFDNSTNAEVRISFGYYNRQRDGGSWAYVGNECKDSSIGSNEPTVNLGWFEDHPNDRAVVLHEFGHVLGLIHEHQNPENGGINWNVNEVYRAYAGPPNYWDQTTTYNNILMKYNENEIIGDGYDPKSIMHYPFDPALINGPYNSNTNTELSTLDKKLIGTIYPLSTNF